MKDKLPQRLGERGATRLARHDHAAALRFEVVSDRLQMRGLSTSINALEGQEKTGRSWISHGPVNSPSIGRRAGVADGGASS